MNLLSWAPKYHTNIFCSFFHVMKSQNQFRRSLRPFLLINFYLEIRRLVSHLAPYKVHKPPKKLYLLTWADTKTSYWYFLFIFSLYVKPKLISEKFEAIFVKHFLPWNLTASKHCSSQIGPETPQKILRGAFSMPKSNSKHTRKWWDSFLIFWLGANRLTRTCAYASRFLVLKIIKNWPFLTTNMG